MRNLYKSIKLSLCMRFFFVVIGDEYGVPHASYTYDEAIEWMACYRGSGMYFRGWLLARNCLSPLEAN